MTNPTEIYFVTWPDGKIVEGSQTSVAEDIAIGRTIMTFLPARLFPKLDLGSRTYGPMRELWESMKIAGFKCQSIDMDANGVSS